MNRPVCIDVCCGSGGASMGYHRAGFDVIGVDHKPMPRYPFEFIKADMLDLDLAVLIQRTGATFLHFSPPCQKWSAYRRRGNGVGETALNLIPDARLMARATGLAYIIENVEYAKAELIDPVMLCGSSFRLDVRRHRMFESNLPLVGKPCDHGWQTPRFTPASNRTNLRRTVEIGVRRIPMSIQMPAMGIYWMKREELSQAIPPAYTEYLGGQVLAQLDARAAA